jgi:4-hydroxy-2-oxoheptanedioate aldolase
MQGDKTRKMLRAAFVVATCSIVSLALVPTLTFAQQKVRLNRAIEALESGKNALSGETWIFTDFEHQPYSIDKVQQTLTALGPKKNAKGQQELAPIVRIPAEGDQEVRWIIKQVLERGAMGIIVPQTDTKEQALKIVQSIRYPQRKNAKYPNPVGRRGSAGMPATWGLATFEDYLQKADPWPLNPDGELLVLPQIESPEGVKNINEILDVPGVTGVLVGPNDLSQNYGMGPWTPKTHTPEVEAAIEAVAKACVAKKKHCGMVTANDADTEKYLKQGYKIILGTYRPGAMPTAELYK